MRKILLWIFVAVLTAIALYNLLSPEKDYRQLALGNWVELSSQYHANVGPDKILFTKGREKHVIYYELHVDQNPMTIDVWRSKDKTKIYRGTVDFKNDNKVEARKIREEDDKGNYFAEMMGRVTFVWERVPDEDEHKK